jgi:hypothetical protein
MVHLASYVLLKINLPHLGGEPVFSINEEPATEPASTSKLNLQPLGSAASTSMLSSPDGGVSLSPPWQAQPGL